jgi:uncharacterized protein
LTTTLRVKESENSCTFDIHVTPRSSRAVITGIQEGILKVKVTAVPLEGAANEACVKLLAKELGLKKNQLSIFAGRKSRHKTIIVNGMTGIELEKTIRHALNQ